jgi:hypothetical protein
VALLRSRRAVDALKLSGDEKTGAQIVRRALETPIRQIADNAGEHGSVVAKNVEAEKDYAWGFDAEKREYVDLIKGGVIDPKKVVRLALTHAASMAGIFLTTEVVITEKVHGTCTLLGLLEGMRAISSKGYGAGGRVIKEDGKNLYWRIARKYQLFERLEGLGSVMLFGETFGSGVQDLDYGVPRDEPSFFAFDLSVGGRYLDFDDFRKLCAERGIPQLEPLFRGPFGPECLSHALGKETLSGKAVHVREGIVIRPVRERYDPDLGRVILKTISAEYLLRGGEATEFE